MNDVVSYFKKNVKKKHLVLFGLGLVLILSGIISWNVYFSKLYTFKNNEDYFLERVKNYYKYFSIYLPKEGKIKVMTLEDMYTKDQMDALYIPGSTKLCDSNSWVKVYNDGGQYRYYTYLKCGKYESNIDHNGPVITLKGDNPLYISLGREYNESGVEKVVDDNDGNINITKVEIDSSNVNTKKVGNYKVVYKVRDSLNNETKLVREVFVTRNLTDLVHDETNDSNYYQGNVNDNYILFSGMMYRIINVNSDGTVTLISNEILNNLRADYDTYENSSIDKYLNTEYLNIINNKDYLVDTEFCVGNVDSLNDLSKNCSSTLKRKIATLDLDKFQKSFSNNESYLCTGLGFTISSKLGDKTINAYSVGKNCIDTISNSILTAIRPVITLKSNLIVLAGNGTYENPYKLDDYSYGRQQDRINTRLVGEYVNYSGSIYRIMGVDKNNNVKLISVKPIVKNISGIAEKEYLISSLPNDKKFVFNTNDTDNSGYILNNNFIDYLNENYIVETEYEIPLNALGKQYNNYSNKKINAKLVLPRTYDLFAGKQIDNAGYMYEYLYIDESENENNYFFIDLRNGRVYDGIKNTNEYTMRVVMTIKGDLLIRSGKGTTSSPYYIR